MGTAMRRIIRAFLMLATITGGASAQTLSLQDLGVELTPLPSVTIYSAKQIVTLDPDKPTAQAVAVVGDRILAVGSLDDLKAAAGAQPYTVDETFANQVMVPGFIAQHACAADAREGEIANGSQKTSPRRPLCRLRAYWCCRTTVGHISSLIDMRRLG